MKVYLLLILMIHVSSSVFGFNSKSNDSIEIDGIWAFQHEKLLNKFHDDCLLLKFQKDTIYELNLHGEVIEKYSYQIKENKELWINDTTSLALITGDENRLIRFWNPEKYGLEWYVSFAYLVKLKPTNIKVRIGKLKKILGRYKYEWEMLNGERKIGESKTIIWYDKKEEANDLSKLEESIVFVHKIEDRYIMIYKSKKKNVLDYIAVIDEICKKEIRVIFSSDSRDSMIAFKRK